MILSFLNIICSISFGIKAHRISVSQSPIIECQWIIIYLCRVLRESPLKPLLLYLSEAHMENNMIMSEQLSNRTLDLFAPAKQTYNKKNIYIKKGLTNLSSIIRHKRKCLCKQRKLQFSPSQQWNASNLLSG